MSTKPTVVKHAAPPGQSCRNCRFSEAWYAPRWNPSSPRRVITECRRFPPAFMPGEDNGADFPMVEPANWCGEWAEVVS